MKTSISTDSEKGRVTISRPKYHWNPQSAFTSEKQGPVTKTAPPARSRDTLQGSPSHAYSLAKSLFRPHKKTGSTTSSTHLLTSTPSSRSHSPTASLEPLESSPSAPLAGRPILDAELAVPPEAIHKSLPSVPRLGHLTIDLPELLPQHGSNSTGPSPPPRGKRSRLSRDLPPIIASPSTMPLAPLLEVTLCSPTTFFTEDGVGSINMYISRHSTMSVELPPFPDTATANRDSSASLPLSSSEHHASSHRARLPAFAADLPVDVPLEGGGVGGSSPLKAAVSIRAVGGGRPTYAHPPGPHPESFLPALAAPPVDSSDASQYTDSEAGEPPSPEEGAGAVREANANAQSRASREGGQSSVQDRPAPRAPPLPPSRRALSSARSVKLFKSPSSSSRYGYV